MKIQRIDSQNVKLGDYTYNTGAVYANYRGDSVDFYHKNGGNSFPIEKNIKYTEITNSAGVAFGTIAQTSAAIAAAIAPGDGVSSILSDKGTVTQSTSITTGVTLSNLNGVVTTVSSTLAADTEATFTVTNTKVTTTSNIMLTAVYPAASAGTPVVQVGAVANGSFTVVITNVNPTNALNAALKIGFLVA